MLDQLFADERRQVGMVEDVGQGVIQILLRCASSRQYLSVKQGLGSSVVLGVYGDHCAGKIRLAGLGGKGLRGSTTGLVRPSGKGAGKVLDRCLVVGRNRISTGVQLESAVVVQQKGSQGE